MQEANLLQQHTHLHNLANHYTLKKLNKICEFFVHTYVYKYLCNVHICVYHVPYICIPCIPYMCTQMVQTLKWLHVPSTRHSVHCQLQTLSATNCRLLRIMPHFVAYKCLHYSITVRFFSFCWLYLCCYNLLLFLLQFWQRPLELYDHKLTYIRTNIWSYIYIYIKTKPTYIFHQSIVARSWDSANQYIHSLVLMLKP